MIGAARLFGLFMKRMESLKILSILLAELTSIKTGKKFYHRNKLKTAIIIRDVG